MNENLARNLAKINQEVFQDTLDILACEIAISLKEFNKNTLSYETVVNDSVILSKIARSIKS